MSAPARGGEARDAAGSPDGPAPVPPGAGGAPAEASPAPALDAAPAPSPAQATGDAPVRSRFARGNFGNVEGPAAYSAAFAGTGLLVLMVALLVFYFWWTLGASVLGLAIWTALRRVRQ